MKRAVCVLAALGVLTTGTMGQVRPAGSPASAPAARPVRQAPPAGAGASSPAPAAAAFAPVTALQMAQAKKTVDTYCIGCHNSKVKAGELALDTLSLDTAYQNADVWEKAIRKMRGRLMPPPTSRQPEQREIDAFVTWMEATLDGTRGGLVAGHVPAQRLSRTEFATSVNDLLGIELEATQVLPAEIEVNGFENIAAALTVSPAFLDQYVAGARLAAKLAVGDSTKMTSATYLLPPSEQPDHVDGLPLGTRGGMKFRHNFPGDGEYRVTILDLGVDLYSRVLDTRHTVIILIDGQEVYRGEIGGSEDLRTVDRKGAPGRAEVTNRFANLPVQVKAGIRDVAVTFIERARVQSDEFVGFLPGDEFSRGDREPRLVSGVKVDGPFNSPGVSETASRRKIFVCRPDTNAPDSSRRSPRDVAAGEGGCARRIAAKLARAAFRRPVTEQDIDGLMPFFEQGRKTSFDVGIEQLISAVLVSPEFLYRSVHVAPAGASGAYRLTDLELASRLSFFLWSQGPDETLLSVAAAGKLSALGALQAQALRMLKDVRAARLVRNFAMRSLDLDKLDQVVPDPNLFPSFSDALRRDMAAEAETFISSILLEDRNIGDLLTANHTFLNDRLAKHYGIASVYGPQFRRVTLDEPRRWGLMGKGAVLLRTSYGDRTSPVLRGAWVLGKLMGTPPTPPPPDVDTDLSPAKGAAPTTLRARLEQHRSKPGCNQCHGVIDPIGLALENFDAVGRWRDIDQQAANAPIDARTVLPNGTPVNGPAQLREALFGGRDLFVRSFSERLMMYALGRELQASDMPQVRSVVRRAATQNNKLSAIVAGIVSTDAFRMQAPPPAPRPGVQVATRD